mmetsp:Transcript_29860/g.61388  ORF Transcript_29860/g.61388 Transcript_29860/m.61388 type:complete len:488 (+) Transcript_29860:280-1743(+)
MPDWWSNVGEDGATVVVHPCPPEFCKGNNTCSQGHTGPACNLCEPGWNHTTGGCEQCDVTENQRVVVALVGVFAALLLWVFTVWWPLVWQDMPLHLHGCFQAFETYMDDKGKTESLKAAVDNVVKSEIMIKYQEFHAFKVVISFYQVVGSYAAITSVPWPDSLLAVYGWTRLVQLDWIALPGFGCLTASWSFEDRFLAMTAGPIVIVTLLGVPLVMVKVCNRLSEFFGEDWASWRFEERTASLVRRQFWFTLSLFLFLVYPAVALFVLQAFNCHNFGVDGNLLALDHRVECPNPSVWLYWLAIVSLAYPFGIPFYLYWILRRFQVPSIARLKMRVSKLRNLMDKYQELTVNMGAVLKQQLKTHQRVCSQLKLRDEGKGQLISIKEYQFDRRYHATEEVLNAFKNAISQDPACFREDEQLLKREWDALHLLFVAITKCHDFRPRVQKHKDADPTQKPRHYNKEDWAVTLGDEGGMRQVDVQRGSLQRL